jgi:hypothetical protein
MRSVRVCQIVCAQRFYPVGLCGERIFCSGAWLHPLRCRGCSVRALAVDAHAAWRGTQGSAVRRDVACLLGKVATCRVAAKPPHPVPCLTSVNLDIGRYQKLSYLQKDCGSRDSTVVPPSQLVSRSARRKLRISGWASARILCRGIWAPTRTFRACWTVGVLSDASIPF